MEINVRKPCPHCNPDQKKRFDPWKESQCVLNKPLFMVIPPEGAHLTCPVHPDGHHVFGSGITWMSQAQPIDYSHDPSKDLTYDSTQPYGTATGGNIRNDTWKFTM